MGFNATVLADSRSPHGVRLTTFSVSYPRIIHAEMLRHRMFSRCAASSRAIPVERFIEQVENEPYMPGEFCANKSGMQAGEPLPEEQRLQARDMWLYARDAAVQAAKNLIKTGVHKQWTNRLLEPFQWMTEVITATEWDNFDHLRIHSAAHPDIQRIARMMREARDASIARELTYNGWHLPLTTMDDAVYPREQQRLISVGRVARVSYLRHDDTSDVEKDIARANKMLDDGHMSPLEHAARPMTDDELTEAIRWCVDTSDGDQLWLQGYPLNDPPREGDTVRKGHLHARITKVHGWKAFCGNFNGWVQLRKCMKNEFDRLAPAQA